MKVAFYSLSDEDLYRYRFPVARHLRAAGFGVVMIGPDGPYAEAVENAGFTYRRFRTWENGMPPFTDLSSGMRLGAVYRDEMPDIAHHFTLRGAVHGGVAARVSGISWVVQSVTSLDLENGESYLHRAGIRPVIRAALRNAEVTFASPEDRQVLIAKGCVRPERTHIIRSAGVDLDAFPLTAEPDRTPVVLLTGSLDDASAIAAFAASARALCAEGLRVRFAIASTTRGKPAVSRDEIETWQEEGVIEWWGYRGEMRRTLSNVHVVCLPTYAGEETPRVLLEAAASGRAVVASDVPACRNLVRPDESGILVKPDDGDDLTSALRRLIRQPELRRQLARGARERIETEFSADRIAREIMSVYELLFEKGREI